MEGDFDSDDCDSDGRRMDGEKELRLDDDEDGGGGGGRSSSSRSNSLS